MKSYRMSKMKGLIDTINENVQTNTQLSLDSFIENPKLVSFKLMKMDMEQSCRAQCTIEKRFAESGENL